ncbi:MAG: PAS domain S-box protein [Anaerolineae bacterium]|nr:PAS domain S-box protein [Anaerolineae bacterium]
MAYNRNPTTPNLVLLVGRAPRFIGIAIIALGVLVLLGWIFNVPALMSVLPGLATMKFNTALLFLFSGIALVNVKANNPYTRIFAGLVVLIAGLTLAEYVLDWNLGIDELVVRDAATLAAGGADPGRMSLMTALSFLVLGTSMLLKKRPLLAQGLTILGFVVALLALVGYLYGVEALYAILPYSSMALHTASAFAFLSLGILASQDDTPLVRVFVSSSAGGIALRRLLPFAILAPLLLGLVRLEGQYLGWYDTDFGAALYAILNIGMLAWVVWWTAVAVHRLDAARLEAVEELQQAHDELENRVQERTAELAAANESLKVSEARFSGVLETAHDGVISIDEQQRIVLFNKGAERIFGYKPEEAIGQSIELLIPDRFSKNHRQHIIDFGRGDTFTRIMAPDRTEVKGRRKNGEEFPADISISALALNNERLFTAVVRDTTEYQRTRDALKASEQRYSLLVNSVRDYAIYMLDANGNVASWNEGATQINGYAEDEVLGQHFSRFYTPEDVLQGEPDRVLETAIKEGHFETEGRRMRKDGVPFWARVAVTPIYGEGQTLLGFSKVVQDLTETKKAEEATRTSEALLSSVLEMLPVGVWITDGEGNITRSNPAGVRIWAGAKYVGLDQYSVYKGWWTETGELIAPDDWAAARAIQKGETSVNESVEIECFDGSHRFILNSGIPIRDEDEKIIGAVVVNHDVTELKQTEAKLRRYTEALERGNIELQMFAYTASHDLQEPLRKIQAFGDRLQALTNDLLSEQARDYLQRMINASNRMQALIEDLLTYSRVTTKTQPFHAVDLNAIIAAVCSDLEIAIERAGGVIEVEPLATIDADDGQMRQLFQNLLSNALKFKAKDRPPLIRISGRVLKSDVNRTSLDGATSSFYEITISDNGIGFEEKYAERIFGMFQRLHGRTEYEGTGIGLAICHKIVERHHGSIIAHGNAGQGASFVITIPMRQVVQEGVGL